MNNLVNKVQQHYIDELTKNHPMHKFLCIYMYLISIYAYCVYKETGIFDILGSLNIKFLFDVNDGLIAKTSILHLIYSVILCLITSKASKLLRDSLFDSISYLKNFDEKVQFLIKKIIPDLPSSSTDKKLVIADLQAHIKTQRLNMQSCQAHSETMLTISGCLLIGIPNIGLLEIIIIFISVIIAICKQWQCLKIYLQKFLPYYAIDQFLQGKDISFLDEKRKPHE